MSEIKLIVGLGNPGEEYANTRHNAGWKVINLLGEHLNANYWKNECGASTTHIQWRAPSKNPLELSPAKKLILAKPQSYMNTSGGPVSKLAAEYNIKPDEILIVHDEMDLPLGTVRVKVAGGHGGHNGLRSIHAKLACGDYVRVRIGTGHPTDNGSVTKHVLSAPKGKDAQEFEHSLHIAADAVMCVLEKGISTAMNRFNVKTEQ